MSMTPTEYPQKIYVAIQWFRTLGHLDAHMCDQSTVPIHCAVKYDILVIRTSRKVHLNLPPKLGLFNGLFKHVLT